MNLLDVKPGEAAVFIGFEGSDEELEKVMEMGFSVGIMVIVKENKGDEVVVEFEDGKVLHVDGDLAKKIVINPV